MATAFLGIGSNLGDRPAAHDAARTAIAHLPGTRILRTSAAIETPPVGPSNQGPFLNAVMAIETSLAPFELLASLQRIETELGREPLDERIRWGPRVIDLDILLYDELILTDERLTIPHPRMCERGFVLDPLAEIAPDLRHPTDGRTIAELREAHYAAEAR